MAHARLESRYSTKTDLRIVNLLKNAQDLGSDPLLKEKVTVTTSSCIEAIKHSDANALIDYLDHCILTNKRKQRYLDERFIIAAHMGNETAMRLLVKAGAKATPALAQFATSFEIKPIKVCIINQYANDEEIKEAKAIAETREYDANFISSVHKFQRKKQKTVDLLTNSRTLVLESVTLGRNIALALARREQHGTT